MKSNVALLTLLLSTTLFLSCAAQSIPVRDAERRPSSSPEIPVSGPIAEILFTQISSAPNADTYKDDFKYRVMGNGNSFLVNLGCRDSAKYIRDIRDDQLSCRANAIGAIFTGGGMQPGYVIRGANARIVIEAVMRARREARLDPDYRVSGTKIHCKLLSTAVCFIDDHQ